MAENMATSNWMDKLVTPTVESQSGGQLPSVNTGMEATRDLLVCGYIAARKNCLAPTISSSELKKVYDTAYKKHVSNNGEKIMKVIKMDADGSPVESDEEITIDNKASAVKLRTIDFQAFLDLKNAGVYKVNMTELKAEYLILVNKYAQKLVEQDISPFSDLQGTKNFTTDIEEFSNATHEKATHSAIKPSKLATLIFTLNLEPLKVVKGDKDVGIVAPTMKKTTSKGKTKYKPSLKIYNSSKEQVPHIGSLGIDYVVNRRFLGDSVVPNSIDNLEKFKAAFPDQSEHDLRLRLVAKKAEKGEKPTSEKEEIPFAEMADVAERIGLTEKMLSDLRRKGSNTNSLSMKEIKEECAKSRLLFMKFNNEK